MEWTFQKVRSNYFSIFREKAFSAIYLRDHLYKKKWNLEKAVVLTKHKNIPRYSTYK